MTLNILYNDVVLLTEDVVQIAVRDNSIDINLHSDIIRSIRFNVNGCWSIVSIDKYDNELINKLKNKILRNVSKESCGEFADAELYKGYIEIGKELPDTDSVVDLVYNLCNEIKGTSNVVRCEAVVLIKNVSRSIERDNNEKAQEIRKFLEVDIGILARSSLGSIVYPSTYNIIISWNPKEVLKNIEESFKTTIERLSNAYRLRSLKPYLYGRNIVILDHIATAALFHEVSHMLDSTHIYSNKLLGYKLGPEDLEVYDEPYNLDTPSIRFFDDEGVIAKKRTLIENGVVRDLHHTRTTAKRMYSEPGSAHGLFHKPLPFHTTLVIKPGDWKINEIFEDTKRGIYIEGINIATLEEGYVRFVPELGYVIEDGELKELIKIREVKIPIQNIKSINALSKTTKIRTSIEKSWIVSEIAPTIRLTAYIQ